MLYNSYILDCFYDIIIIHYIYMPFISNYNGAMKILGEIGTGTCKETCKTTWIRNIKYALKTKTNPLHP